MQITGISRNYPKRGRRQYFEKENAAVTGTDTGEKIAVACPESNELQEY